MGSAISKGKNGAVEKDHKGLVLEGSSHFKENKAIVKKKSGSSNSISQKKTIHVHSDILPTASLSGSSDFKGGGKNVTKVPGPFLNDGDSKHKTKSTKKEIGVSNSALQKKPKHSDILPAVSHSGSSDFITGDENDTNNPGSLLDDGFCYKHTHTFTEKESGGSNSILQEKTHCDILPESSYSGSSDCNSDHEKNETNNPKLKNKLSDIFSESFHSGSWDLSFDDDENETKKNTFNEQFECDISKSSSDAEEDSLSKTVRCLDDSSKFERPDQIKKRQARSIKYVTDIEDDHKHLNTLFSAAKEGKWDNVWDILKNKPYMINCCPENRRYTLLHQAAFWNDKQAVKNLLRFPTIDSNGKIKKYINFSTRDDNGLTALELAQCNRPLSEVTSILCIFVCKIDKQEVDTYHLSDEEPAIIRLTLAAYKNTFHPATIEPNKPLYDVLKDVFKLMNTTIVWKTALYQICESVRYIKDGSQIIDLIELCQTPNEFFKAVINLYTREDFDLYAGVNMALRRQRSADFKPTSEDLAFGPYVLVLQTLLWFWDELKYESSITFRKMLLSENDLDKYQKGISFTWLSFVSSSVNRQMAISFPSRYPEKQKNTNTKSVLFIFDNKNAGQCQPKNVQKFAHVHKEEERVYAAGSRFCVTSRKDLYYGDAEICLQVISN